MIFFFLQRSKTGTDRKKLEPLRGGNSNSTSHAADNTGHSLTEATDPAGHYNDDEPSISENTISSDKQLFSNIRIPKKKVALFSESKITYGTIFSKFKNNYFTFNTCNFNAKIVQDCDNLLLIDKVYFI
jgi:hypothetical protein